MEIWEVTNSAAVGKNSAQTSYKTAGGVSSEYAKILAQKISNVESDVKEMEAVQEQLDEIDEMQVELAGNVNTFLSVEKVRRFMPDGSILVTTYTDGKVTEQFRKKPHMVPVPDFSAPPKVDGSPETKLEPRQSLDLMELLRM